MLSKKATEVLSALQHEGILNQVLLVGSWCAHFYRSYFKGKNFNPGIRTLDIDFLIPQPRRLKGELLSVDEILHPLGFETDFTSSGWIRFLHPELRVEFLVPRLGPISDEPQKIEKLGITATPLRHTSVLIQHQIAIEDNGIRVNIPHPIAFALHKLFISTKRKEQGKVKKDQSIAFRIFENLDSSELQTILPKIWYSFTRKEQKVILGLLDILEEGKNLLKILNEQK